MRNPTVYVSIGNSDDRLSQQRWAMYQIDVAAAVLRAGVRLHGEWSSHPTSQWQNACWCIEIVPSVAPRLRSELTVIADAYGQDAVAWAEVRSTVFLGPGAAGWAAGDSNPEPAD